METNMDALVNEALLEYIFLKPQLTFIRHNENITYMIEDDDKKYVLRIRKPVQGFQDDIFVPKISSYDLIENEIKVIDYARKHTNINLQKPVKNKKGGFVSCLSDGSPVCCLEWIDGSILIEDNTTEEQAKLLGSIAAQLHKGLQLNECNIKRYSYANEIILPMKSQINDALKKGQIEKSEAIMMKDSLDIISERMNELNKIQGMFGIVHGDLGLSNVIVTKEGLTPIDFSLSGYGFYFMEVAMMISQFKDKNIRKAIKLGYEMESNILIPIRHIDAFFAFNVLLYICSQHDKAYKEDWFSKAMKRWCNTIFQPLIAGIEYVL